jgi:glycosyltransferase involved in cell wall biosynthesis
VNGQPGSPGLSVVIAAHNAVPVIELCLCALEPQATAANAVEIIVADSSTDGTADLIRRRFPQVKVLHFDDPLTLPQLRGRGIAAARGEVIALLDPYSIVDGNWVAQVLQEHRMRPHPVIGGAVDPFQADRQGWPAWAQYWNEYGMFLSPVREGPVDILPGSNLSYKRVALFEGERPRYEEFWKTFANWDVEAGGLPLWLAPAIRVELYKPIPFRDFLATRFHHGRCFAGMRSAGASRPARWVRALLAPVLPAVFIWRWSRGFWTKGRYRMRYLLSLPLQVLLFGNWARGEMMGYLAGSGQSCKELFY